MCACVCVRAGAFAIACVCMCVCVSVCACAWPHVLLHVGLEWTVSLRNGPSHVLCPASSGYGAFQGVSLVRRTLVEYHSLPMEQEHC